MKTRASSVIRILPPLLLAICVLFLACTGLARLWLNQGAFTPFWNFPFEWEWSDGELFGAVRRIREGIPFYADWSKGQVIYPYGPLYAYLIHALDRLFGANTTIHAYRINLTAFFLTVLLFPAAFLVQRGEKRNPASALAAGMAGLLAIAFFTLPFEVFDIVRWARTDTLWLFLSVLTPSLVASSRRPKTLVLAGIVGAAAAFAKQKGVVIVGACAAHLLVAEWVSRRSIRESILFSLSAGATLVLGTLYLEVVNNGYFLESTISGMSKAFSRDTRLPDGSYILSFDYFLEMFRSHYLPQWQLLALGALSLLAPLLGIGRFTPVHATLLALSLTTPYFAMNRGGGPSYFWPHLWCLSFAAADLIRSSSSAFVSERARRARPGAPAAFLALSLGLLVPLTPVSWNAMRDFGLPRPGEEHIRVASSGYGFVASLVREDPSRRFLFDRYTGALVEAGYLPEVDTCTLYHAGIAGFVDLSGWVDEIRERKFYLITANSWLDGLPEIRKALHENYVRAPELDARLQTNRGVLPKAWRPRTD